LKRICASSLTLAKESLHDARLTKR